MICSERRLQIHPTINIIRHAMDVIVSQKPKQWEMLITANHVSIIPKDLQIFCLT